MKRLLTSIITACAVTALHADDATDVRKAFDDYKAAILEQRGTEAAELVTRRTLEEYQKYRDWALFAPRITVQELSLLNRFQVAIVRHRVPTELLQGMDGRMLFAYAVDHDWIGKNGVIRLSIGEVEIASGRATAVVVLGGNPTEMRFQFRKEEDKWRFDLVYLMQLSNTALAQSIKAKGLSEDGVIFQLLETVSGRKVDDSIWDPLAVRNQSSQPSRPDGPRD
ncbi:MAG TPA: hypothetical protein VIK52_07045 [Opitutaceae bacterium]